MNIIPVKRALISVYDKANILPLAKFLADRKIEILSSGGTYRLLIRHNLKVTEISKYTQTPELFDGRVKTLHPKIHGGLLYARNNPEHQKSAQKLKIKAIDLAVVNLYPFSETVKNEKASLKKAIEMIDIGGPALIRSAAKNFEWVTVLCDFDDYDTVKEELTRYGGITKETRQKLAAKAFLYTHHYDQAIANYLISKYSNTEILDLHYVKAYNLRYGENPHQKAIFFRNPYNKEHNVTNGKCVNGKQLSFNNILDCDASIELVREFEEPTVAVIKHTNPCGVAIGKNDFSAFKRAYAVDSKSAYGSVVALNTTCSKETAKFILKQKLFLEVIAAPNFGKEAIEYLTKSKNLRIIVTGKLEKPKKRRDIKKVSGGILVQTADIIQIMEQNCKTVTKIKPTSAQIKDLLFAAKVVKHVKSNAIVFARDRTSTGIGAGQMSRVDAVFLAAHKAGIKAKGSVMASDAFLPFPDAVEEAYKAGIKAIIQPGGSIRDQEVIKMADKLGIAMIFSGIRNFKH